MDRAKNCVKDMLEKKSFVSMYIVQVEIDFDQSNC